MKNRIDILLMFSICGILLLTFFSGKTNHKINAPRETNTQTIPDSLFHSGDIIFRDGRGFISNAFRKLNLTDPRYSHAGIIHRENGKVYVYHVIGGEENKNNRMRKDELGKFCSSLEANSFAVYRTDLNARSIDSLATIFYRKKIEFDLDFNLATDDKMYCTELVYKVLSLVSGKNNYLPLTILQGVKYEACDNIYLSSHTKKIYSFDYSF